MRLLVIFLISLSSYAGNKPFDEKSVLFSGRVSRINKIAELMRIKVDFENSKYLSAKDKIEFWNETYPDKKCLAFVEGRSATYLLVKVPDYNTCITKVHVSVGTYLHLYSTDLERKLKVAEELVEVLLKKRLALRARLNRYQKEVDSYVEKLDATNKRYEILRQKLELEWQNEITALEEDKTKSYLQYKHSQARLNELEHKLQIYRVQDENLVEDRWSLDPKLYFKK
jgi:tRNA U55 pseudouridine synthase TruB